MPTIEANGCELHYEQRGSGDPLLLLHGGTGVGADWQLVFPSNPAGYRSIAPDLRGHGRSTNSSGTFTFRQCAHDMFALLDYLQLATVKAIGVSAGAKTLLHMATQQPNRIAAMVVVSATPYFPASARAAMAQFTVDALSPEEWTALRQRHVRGDDQIRMLYRQMHALKDSHDDMAFTPPLLATITAPTLIVHGDRDPLYPVELALELYRSIAASALWIVPDGGHGPIFGELAAPFAATALKHLARIA
jgi:pimeloyl-ACP methyl ester carboxylesterase